MIVRHPRFIFILTARARAWPHLVRETAVAPGVVLVLSGILSVVQTRSHVHRVVLPALNVLVLCWRVESLTGPPRRPTDAAVPLHRRPPSGQPRPLDRGTPCREAAFAE